MICLDGRSLESSAPALIKDLIHCIQTQNNSKKRSRNVNRKLRSIAFEILIFGSRPNLVDNGMSPVDRLLAAAFNLRLQTKFNEANELEACLFKLRTRSLEQNDIVKNILSFLLFLTNEGKEEEVGFATLTPRWQSGFPSLYQPIFPDGPVAYPNTVYHKNNKNNFFYTYYPKELFEKPPPDLNNMKNDSWIIDSKIFELPPGTSHFVQLPSKNRISPYMQQLSQTLYGALTHPISDPSNMDVRLEIPELGDTSPANSLGSHFYGKSSTKSQISDDEGFTEPETPVPVIQNKGTSIWEEVLGIEARTYFTWEGLGNPIVHYEKPFLTEAGVCTVNEIEVLWENELKLLHPTLNFPSYCKKTAQEILRDISYVMLGISSTCFWFSDAKNKFIVCDHIVLVGWSHQGLLSLLTEFADTGTFYYKIKKFSVDSNVIFGQGLVFQDFIHGLRRFLQYYEALVLILKTEENILQFTIKSRKLRSQLQYIAELCGCGVVNMFDLQHPFPVGMQLLSYLYSKVLEAMASDFYLVVLSLLISSSVPYLKFLQSWAFNGFCNDPYDEFPITPNESYIGCRDHRYWSKAYRLSTSTNEENWPLVSVKLMQEVHNCGKGVNLLKLCAPQHHICTNNNVEAPELKLTVSKKELDTLHWQSAKYSTSMESIRKEKRVSWREVEVQKEKDKEALQTAAIVGAAATISRMEKKLTDAREAKMAEKRRQMAELQAQIKDIQERRRQEKEKEIEDEEQRLLERGKEQADRIQLLEHYQNLNVKAEMRERRTEWRNRRLRMQSERVEFLEHDKRQVTHSLASLHTNLSSQENLQSMQISPDQATTPEICPSDSVDSFETGSVFHSNSCTVLQTKDVDVQLIISTDTVVSDNETKLLTEANVNDANANAIGDESKVVKRPDLLTLNAHSVKKISRQSMRKPKSKFQANSDSSGIGDVGDWVSEQSSITDAGALINRNEGNTEGNCKELIMRLISEDSSGRDSGMSLQTPDETTDEKVDTPMSMLSNTHSSDSVISSFVSNEEDYVPPGLALINVGTVVRTRGRNEHGHASESTLQSLMYPDKKAGIPLMKQTLKHLDFKNMNVRVKRRNVFGHASDSTIQTMMYGDKSISAPTTPLEEKAEVVKERFLLRRSKSVVTPYAERFNFKGDYPLVHVMSPGFEQAQEKDDSLHETLPLPVFIRSSLMGPLTTQISLVTKGVYDFFMVDLKTMQHLEMLRSFLLLHDGEFAQAMSDQLFDRMNCSRCPAELLNPVTLNSILNKSFNASLQRDNPFVKNFSFSLHAIPHVFPLHVAAPFDGLDLEYKVDWPLNIILTGSALSKYNKLFRFLMQIRHTAWVLNDVFYHLKRNVRAQNSSSLQYRQLQYFRHEMHHFIRVLQSYISSQVLHVSWAELYHDMTNDVQMLDHLYDVHMKYLNRALFRCLLHKKAAPVMRVIQLIFSIILKFHAQMVSLPWKSHSQTGTLEHPSYGKLFASYRIFRQYAGFLYKLMTKLVTRGYQQHLNELLLMYNFNPNETELHCTDSDPVASRCSFIKC